MPSELFKRIIVSRFAGMVFITVFIIRIKILMRCAVIEVVMNIKKLLWNDS